jgi:hypothetical protein
MRQEDLSEGYHIFTATGKDEQGYSKAAEELQKQVKDAEKDFDITYISNASFKDDPGERRVCFASQTCVLKRKE